jgi:hypothetical protein
MTERHDGAYVQAGSDDEMLALVGAMLRATDPPPSHVTAGAKAAFTWRTIDAELAELVFDSASDLAGVRSESGNRQVTFRAPGVEIEVMVIDDERRRLVGQLIPPGEAEIELVSGDAVRSVSSDAIGRFAVDEIEPGPVRIVVLGADGQRSVQTEWMLL